MGNTVWDYLTGKNQKRLAQQQQELEQARKASLIRASQSQNQQVANRAKIRLVNNGQQVQRSNYSPLKDITKVPRQFADPFAKAINTGGAMVTKLTTVPFAAVDLTRESLTGTDESYKRKLQAYNNYLATGGLGKKGGLLNAGTSLQNVNELDDPRKLAGSIVETGTTLGSFVPTGKAVQAGVTGVRAVKPLLTYSGANAALNAAGTAGTQVRETGKIDPKGLLLPAALGAGLPIAGYGAGKVLRVAPKAASGTVRVVDSVDKKVASIANPAVKSILANRRDAVIAFERETNPVVREQINRYIAQVDRELGKLNQQTKSNFFNQRGSLGPQDGEPYKFGKKATAPKTVEKTYYHGTQAPIKGINELDEMSGRMENLFGPGIYLTDNKNIASGYAGSRGANASAGKVLQGGIGDAKLYNLEDILPKDVADIFQKKARGLVDYPEDLPDFSKLKGVDAIRELKKYLPDSETYDDFFTQELHPYMKNKGYDGFSHIGGVQGGEKHNVAILFDNKKLKPTPVKTVEETAQIEDLLKKREDSMKAGQSDYTYAYEQQLKALGYDVYSPPVAKNTSKVGQLNKPNQSLKLGTQKTQQTQPNLSQAKNVADDLTNNKIPVQQTKQGELSNLQAKNIPGNTSSNIKPQRGFKGNLSQDTETPLAVYKDIPGYNVKTNAKTIGSAAKRVAKDPEGTYNRLLENGIQKTDDSADALVLLRNLVENDELDKAGKLAQATAKAGTDFGQAVQIFSAFRKTTPDGALRDAWNIVNAYNAKNPKKAPIRISEEQTKRITELANDLQKSEYGSRDWAKKAALLEREKGLLTPNTFLSKVSTVQTMAQLLNPKTAIRNVIGNGVLDLVEDLSRLPATGLDKSLKALGFIDERNMVLPSMKTNWANKLIGFKQGVEDVNLGIRTTGAAGNYDLTKEVFKPGSVGNKLEKLLGYELSSMDKAFFTGRYQSSLENMMKAQKVSTPTPEMKLTAEAEALYATFQNNSNLSKALQTSKNALNFGKEWGLGDLILKYPKTPGNIVNVGLDYSPVGFLKGLKSLHDGIKLKNIKDIRNGELLLGRSLTGTGLIAGGAFLANQGIITGKQDGDFDKSAADRELGQGPFSFNITALGRLLKGEETKTRPGDITANYDWLQPNAIQLSMGANMIINNGSADKQINAGIESLGAGIDTISEQPVFKGVKDFVSDLNTQQGGGLGKAMQGVAVGSASSFVPSLVNQVGQQFDNTKRATYDNNPTVEAINKIKGRTPGARNTLYPSLNTLGQEQKQYDVGGNNPINVFFNPAFLNRVKDSKPLTVADELNKSTGETTQYPRSLTGKQTIDGVKTKLTAEQLNDLKKTVGTTTDQVFTSFANNPKFNSLPDTEKVKVLSNALTDINAAGRATIAAKYNLGQYAADFDGKPTELESGAKKLLTGEYNIDEILDKRIKGLTTSTKTPTVKTSKKRKAKTARRKSGRKSRKTAKIATAKLPKLKTTFNYKAATTPKVRMTRIKKPKLSFRKPALKIKLKS